MSTTGKSISYSKLYFGGIEGGEIIPSTAPGLKGSMTQVHFNGQEFFELSRAGQLDAKLKENNNAKLGNCGRVDAILNILKRQIHQQF